MRDFHILVQVSLDRLYATCAGSEVDASRPSYPNYHCQRARDGASPPQDTALESGGSYERDDDESELHYVMRLLAEYQFEFEDLDLEPKQAQHAPIQIRRDLLEALTALSNKQPSRLQRTAMLTSGRFALNTVAYEPPKHWGYFILGTGMELGGSVLPFPTKPPNPLRLNLALQIGSVRTLVKPRVETLTFYLVGGLELEMLWWKWSQKAQPMLGIRAGYQFGIADRFTARPCTSDNALDDARNCSQPVLQPYVAFAPLERLRLQLTFTWFPQPQAFGDQRFDGLFGVGYQFF